LRTVLVGSALSAAYALEGLLDAGATPAGVVTVDRRKAIEASGMEEGYFPDLVAQADSHGLPCHVTDDPARCADVLTAFHPDIVYAVGWPYLVRGELLDLCPWVGMHPSRLPERRGGAPLNWQILDGLTESAVTLQRLKRTGVDNGDILAQEPFRIRPDAHVGEVLAGVCELTRRLVAATHRRIVEDGLQGTPQDESRATYTRRRRPEDGEIDWHDSSRRIFNLIRAVSHPFPGAFTASPAGKVTVWRAEPLVGERAPLRARPGEVVAVRERGALVSTLDNGLWLTEIQPDGRGALTGPEIKQRGGLRPGMILGARSDGRA